MAAHQTKLNVLGNNIANVNTYGFKSSRVVFSDVLYQNLSTATGATDVTGGTNASQLGYGTKVGSIDMMNTISSGASTGRALDVYIAGEGYLAVQPSAGENRYTRVGNLKFDAEGNLTDGAGSRVMGIPLDQITKEPILNADGTLPVDGLIAINVDPTELEKYTGITIGKSGEITGIRAGDPEISIKPASKDWLKSATIEPTSNYTGDIKMSITSKVAFTEDIALSGLSTPDFTTSPSTANVMGPLNLVVDSGSYTLKGTDKSGNSFSVVGSIDGGGICTFDLPDTSGNPIAGAFTVTVDDPSTIVNDTYLLGVVEADLTDPPVVSATVTTKGGTMETYTIPWDITATGNVDVVIGAGNDAITLTVDALKFTDQYNAATMINIPIGTAEVGSDKPVTLGYLAIAKFANTDGLLQDGNGYFMESANSGQAIASKAGTNGTGGTQSANLEMSNVDLSQEFTDMIIAQRGFQANSRIITVSDSILEELINLKR